MQECNEKAKLCYQQPALLPYHSTDITMKECAAYGGVTAHSVTEDVYENPRWIYNHMHAFWIDINMIVLIYRS